MRRATLIFTTRHPAVRVFLSTLSLRRATLADCTKFYPIGISIHALLAESDLYSSSSSTPAVHFYPRSPCGERRAPTFIIYSITNISIHALLAESDQCGTPMYTAPSPFLSTLSLRRATLHCKTPITFRHYFYPRSPCGERRVTVLGIQHRVGISIHALLAESDGLFFLCRKS